MLAVCLELDAKEARVLGPVTVQACHKFVFLGCALEVAPQVSSASYTANLSLRFQARDVGVAIRLC